MMDNEQTPPADAGRLDQPVRPIAYLYHDASVPEDAHPWLHSTMLVLAADRRPGLRGETELFSAGQMAAAVAAERERCAKICEAEADRWHGSGSTSAERLCAALIRRA